MIQQISKSIALEISQLCRSVLQYRDIKKKRYCPNDFNIRERVRIFFKVHDNKTPINVREGIVTNPFAVKRVAGRFPRNVNALELSVERAGSFNGENILWDRYKSRKALYIYSGIGYVESI